MQEHCEARGCCYDPNVGRNDDVPWCFYPTDYPTYRADSLAVSSGTDCAYSNLKLDMGEHLPLKE